MFRNCHLFFFCFLIGGCFVVFNVLFRSRLFLLFNERFCFVSQTNCVVMLTQLVEKGRNKCELYFPLGAKSPNKKSFFCVKTTKIQDKFTFDSKNSQQFEEEVVAFEEKNEVEFGRFRIRFARQEQLGECTLRWLEVCKRGEERRMIYHYWFPKWLDHKMANPEQVLKIALHVINLTNSIKIDNNNLSSKPSNHKTHPKKPSEIHSQKAAAFLAKPQPGERKKSLDHSRPPTVVHCSAGIGRTGCFLAVLNGIQQLRMNYNVDVLAILCSLRLNRGGMVQTAEQYELIHRVLSLYTDLI